MLAFYSGKNQAFSALVSNVYNCISDSVVSVLRPRCSPELELCAVFLGINREVPGS